MKRGEFSGEDDYSDAEEELEANLDTDYYLKLIDDSSLY